MITRDMMAALITLKRGVANLDPAKMEQFDFWILEGIEESLIYILSYVRDTLDAQNQPVEEKQDFLDDSQADADALASAGWGTDEDYGDFGGDRF